MKVTEVSRLCGKCYEIEGETIPAFGHKCPHHPENKAENLNKKTRDEAIKLAIKMYPHKHGDELAMEIIDYLDRQNTNNNHRTMKGVACGFPRGIEAGLRTESPPPEPDGESKSNRSSNSEVNKNG